MASGRTPTLVISGTAGTVTLEDAHAAWPPPALSSTRRFEERQTRQSSTGTGKTVLVFRPFDGSENSIRGTIDHLLAAQHTILQNLHRANPPQVTVTYMGQTFTADLVTYDAKPDYFYTTEFQADFELRRRTT